MDKVKNFVSQGIEDLKSSARTVGDDINMILETPRGKMKEEYLEKKYNRPAYNARQREKVETKRAGGTVGSASKRADGCAQRGKTRGKMV